MLIFLFTALTQDSLRMEHIKAGEEVFKRIYQAQSGKGNVYLEGFYYLIRLNPNTNSPDTGHVWAFQMYYKKNGDYVLMMSRRNGAVVFYQKKIGNEVEIYDSSTPKIFSAYINAPDTADPAKFGISAKDMPKSFFILDKEEYEPDSTDFKFPAFYKVWADDFYYEINTLKKKINKIEFGKDYSLKNFVWEEGKKFPVSFEFHSGDRMPGIVIKKYDLNAKIDKSLFKFENKER